MILTWWRDGMPRRSTSLQWCHNEGDDVSNHQPHDCLLRCSGADHRKHQSSASLAFVTGVHRPVTWNFCPFDDVIMSSVWHDFGEYIYCCAGDIYNINRINVMCFHIFLYLDNLRYPLKHLSDTTINQSQTQLYGFHVPSTLHSISLIHGFHSKVVNGLYSVHKNLIIWENILSIPHSSRTCRWIIHSRTSILFWIVLSPGEVDGSARGNASLTQQGFRMPGLFVSHLQSSCTESTLVSN